MLKFKYKLWIFCPCCFESVFFFVVVGWLVGWLVFTLSDTTILKQWDENWHVWQRNKRLKPSEWFFPPPNTTNWKFLPWFIPKIENQWWLLCFSIEWPLGIPCVHVLLFILIESGTVPLQLTHTDFNTRNLVGHTLPNGTVILGFAEFLLGIADNLNIYIYIFWEWPHKIWGYLSFNLNQITSVPF